MMSLCCAGYQMSACQKASKVSFRENTATEEIAVKSVMEFA